VRFRRRRRRTRNTRFWLKYGDFCGEGLGLDGGIYGAADGDLRWDFTVTVGCERSDTSLLVDWNSWLVHEIWG